MNKYIYYLVSLIMLIALGFLADYLIVGSSDYVSLNKDSISWLSFQALGNSKTNYYPTQNVNYKLTNKDFNGGSWVVVKAIPINASSDSQTMVFSKGSRSNYIIAAGPTNIFNKNSLDSVPNNIVDYLTRNGVVSAN